MDELRCRRTALPRQWMILHGSILVKKTKVMMMMTPQKMTPFLTQRHQQRKRESGTRTNLPSSQNVHIATENSQILNITSTSNIHRSVCANICECIWLNISIFSWRITSARRVATAAISRPTWRGTSPTWVRYLKFQNICFLKIPLSAQVHQKQRRACPVCGKRYSDLRQHIRLVHEGHKVRGHNIVVYLKSYFTKIWRRPQNKTKRLIEVLEVSET